MSVTRRARRIGRLKGELDQRRMPEPVHNGLKPTPHVRALLWLFKEIVPQVYAKIKDRVIAKKTAK